MKQAFLKNFIKVFYAEHALHALGIPLKQWSDRRNLCLCFVIIVVVPAGRTMGKKDCLHFAFRRQSLLQIFAEFTELFSVHRCTGRRRHLLDSYTGFPLFRSAWFFAVGVDCCFYGRDCNQQKCGHHDCQQWARHERTHRSCDAGTDNGYGSYILQKDFGQTIQ